MHRQGLSAPKGLVPTVDQALAVLHVALAPGHMLNLMSFGAAARGLAS